jgi:hypothetical protein
MSQSITITLVLVISIIIFLIPVSFQLAVGYRSLRRKIKIKFWLVCSISLLSQLALTISLLLMMIHNMKKSGIRDGLGALFLEYEGIIVIGIILIVISIQLMIDKKNEG